MKGLIIAFGLFFQIGSVFGQTLDGTGSADSNCQESNSLSIRSGQVTVLDYSDLLPGMTIQYGGLSPVNLVVATYPDGGFDLRVEGEGQGGPLFWVTSGNNQKFSVMPETDDPLPMSYVEYFTYGGIDASCLPTVSLGSGWTAVPSAFEKYYVPLVWVSPVFEIAEVWEKEGGEMSSYLQYCGSAPDKLLVLTASDLTMLGFVSIRDGVAHGPAFAFVDEERQYVMWADCCNGECTFQISPL